MVYLSKGGFWMLIPQIINAFAIFFLSIIFANFLSPNTYGIYKYVVSAAGIITAFSLTGIGTLIVQQIGKGKTINLLSLFKISIRWNIPSILIAFTGSIYYFIQNNYILSLGFLSIALFTPFISSGNIYDAYLNGLRLFKIKSIFSIISIVLTTAALAITALYHGGATLIIFIYFISYAIVNMLFFVFTLKRIFPKHNATLPEETSIGLAKHLSLIKILGIIASKIDSILVFTFIGAAELAMYTFATAIPNQILAVTKNLYTLALPKFAANNFLTGVQVNRKALRLLFVNIPIYIGYIIVAPFIFKLFFPTYLEAVSMSQIFALLIIFGAGGLHGAYLDAQEEIRKKYFITIAVDSFNILILILLIIPFGLWGVIAARIIGQIFAYITLVITLATIKKRPLEELPKTT